MKLLVINPGATSTKVALFDGETELKKKTLRHSAKDLDKYDAIIDQKDCRLGLIKELMAEWGVEASQLAAVVGRGGPLPPVESGTYEVNRAMLDEIHDGTNVAEHPALLGALLANDIAGEGGVSAYVVDPVSVDEFPLVARLTGIPDLERRSLFHALNIFAVMHTVVKELGVTKDEFNGVAVHLGGGISVACIRGGKVIDVNNANDGNPFSPTRGGGLPASQLVKLCYSGKYSEREIGNLCKKSGGATAYMGTSDMLEVEKMEDAGDEFAKLINEGMAYGIAKEVGAMAAVLGGDVDAIYLTGSLAYNEKMVAYVRDRVKWIVGGEDRVFVLPGEDEMWALAAGVRRVLDGEEEPKIYVFGGLKRDDILYHWRKEHGYV
ncbi:MAG: butyrate kinase [bacterium]|nr:butyrate kinase [bacterium]